RRGPECEARRVRRCGAIVVEPERSSPAHAAATRRAPGVCGSMPRCSSSPMDKAWTPPRALPGAADPWRADAAEFFHGLLTPNSQPLPAIDSSPMLDPVIVDLALGLGLGLLIGFEREWSADDEVAGVRTFALVALLGVIAGQLA